jgi:hypothetical protein
MTSVATASARYVTVSPGDNYHCRPVLARNQLGQSHSQGEKLANLPVRAPIKFELVIDLNTAHTLALRCPRPCSPAPASDAVDGSSSGR